MDEMKCDAVEVEISEHQRMNIHVYGKTEALFVKVIQI